MVEGGGMTRGNITISRGEQEEVTAPDKNKRGTTRGGNTKRGGGCVVGAVPTH